MICWLFLCLNDPFPLCSHSISLAQTRPHSDSGLLEEKKKEEKRTGEKKREKGEKERKRENKSEKERRIKKKRDKREK